MSTLLLHSVSYAGLWGQPALNTEQFIDKAAELGFGGIMLAAKRPHVSVLDASKAARTRLRTRLEKRNLTDLCLAGYCNLTADLDHPDVPTSEIQTLYLIQLAQLASDLGGSLVRIFTGYENPKHDYSRQLRLIANSLREASRRASDLGVTFAVQNHHDLAVGYETLHDLITLVNEPNCRAGFDAWAPALHNADLTQAAILMAPITVHTTVADYVKRPRYTYDSALVNYREQLPFIQAVPMGEGFIDYKSFFEALRDGGFRGSIAYEMCSPLLHGSDMATLDRYANHFLDYMANLSSTMES
jgi:sugar phosphate isomerase/epimerase